MGGRFLGVAAFCLALCAPARAVERPPQFVIMAFDNCTELERWKELSAFAADMNASGKPLHFTFFVSGINFIADDNASVYQPPNRRRGASEIGFGGTADDVAQRVGYINDLYRNGHEIASHAVGHFNGSGWSAADWMQEFSSFRDILTNVAANNGLDSTVKFAFPPSEVIGFRAPYLATSAGLYTALKDDGFRYDTSSDSAPGDWPDKVGGLWRFNLAELKLADSGRHALSMDFNFFAAQSHMTVEPSRRDAFREEMLQTYLAYFHSNYAGNRAPLNIGHHFFDYQDGAYREALEMFARTVCGLPEVRCATYTELADFLDSLDAPTREAYRNGDFPHTGAPSLAVAAREPPLGAPDRLVRDNRDRTRPAQRWAARGSGGTSGKPASDHHDRTGAAPSLAEKEAGGTSDKPASDRHDRTGAASSLAEKEANGTSDKSESDRRDRARPAPSLAEKEANGTSDKSESDRHDRTRPAERLAESESDGTRAKSPRNRRHLARFSSEYGGALAGIDW
jgi:peptidoglycan/xylan/chitin deacetylase (PgdA/CDA1 family)